jgi:hypothetical protein
VIAVLASLSIIVVTVALVWFLRPNRDSAATPTTDTTPVTATTAAPGETTTVPPTTAPASSTP